MAEYGRDGVIHWQSYPEVGTENSDDLGVIYRAELPSSHLEFDSAGKNM